MTPNQERRLEEIFGAARALPAQERAAFLERACGGDVELRRQADSLLAADEQAGQFLQPAPLASTPTIPAEKPGDRIGRYKLLEQIGEGGFGVVWMAEQEEPVRRRVALKIIKLGMDTKEVVARFEAERQALAMMAHENIASIYDGGATATGRPYFVMELVKGVPITDYCDANQLSTQERLELFVQVCQAVQHAHQKGVIHRDLKPSNILVTVKDDRPVAKVIDFGVAKATQARLTEKTLFTQLRQRIGTPAYMSPEQAGLGSLDVDTRTDIYSLGVLLYELLTGRTPFDTQQLLEIGYDAILRTIREEEPPKPSTRLSTLAEDDLKAVAAKRRAEPAKLNRLVRGDLDWIVMKSLEKDRTRRYQTMSDFAQDIDRHLRSEPVSAAAPGMLYRTQKFLRRNRARVVVSALLVLVFGLAGVGVKLALRAQSSRQALQAMGTNAVFTTAHSGNTDALRRLLDADPRLVNARDAGGATALGHAASAGQVEAVRLLLTRGALVDATNHIGFTPLLHAALKGHPDTVAVLLDAGANPNHTQGGVSPLLAAALAGSTNIGRVLLARGARVEAVYFVNKVTALHQAAMLGHAGFVSLLLEYGARPDQQDSNGFTPLHNAGSGLSGMAMARLWGLKTPLTATEPEGGLNEASAGAVWSNEMARAISDLPPSFLSGGGQHARAAELLRERGAPLEVTNAAGCTPLLMAALFTNSEVARVLLAHRANVNARASDGSTPLNLAALKGSVAMAELLLKAGADPNLQDNTGFTPLNTAIEHGKSQVVQLLLAHGANPDLACPSDRTGGFNGQAPMHTAATRGDIESMRLLLARSASLHPLTPLGTPLAWAVSTRQLEAVKFLLQQGAKPDVAPPQNGMTALSLAAMLGQPEVVKVLLEAGAMVDANSSWQGTPLNAAAAGREAARNWAASAHLRAHANLPNSKAYLPCIGSEDDYAEVLRILLAAKADLNAREKRFDRTPLLTAASQGHLGAVNILLEKGADIQAVDRLGLTVLHVASESTGSASGLSNVVRRLIRAGASIEARDQYRATPLHAAANTGKPVMAKLLLEAGARINVVGPNLCTALQLAVMRGHREVAELLLAKGADPEWRDSSGSTALLQAVQLRAKDTVLLLLEHDANVNAGNPEGSTALMVAADAGDVEMMKLLIKRGAKIDTANQNGWTAFMAAAQSGQIEAAQFLLEQGAEFDVSDNNQITPLIIAAKNGRLAMVKFLLEHKARIEDRNKYGFTALHEAADRGHAEVAEFLLRQGADVQSRSDYPSTPLHNAANAVFTNETYYCAVAKVLLAHGAKVNARMRDNHTPLHRAAAWGRAQMIKLLLDANADPNARDDDGKTPLDLAMANKHKECVEILRNITRPAKDRAQP